MLKSEFSSPLSRFDVLLIRYFYPPFSNSEFQIKLNITELEVFDRPTTMDAFNNKYAAF